MNDNNWVSQVVYPRVTDIDKKTLERAKRQEKQMIKEGYRWHVLNKREMILVPYGKDGKPTKKGLELIEKYNNR